MLRPARVPNRTSRHPSLFLHHTTSTPRDFPKLRSTFRSLVCFRASDLDTLSDLGFGSCLLLAARLQAPISDCRPPLALQFHEWPTSFALHTTTTTTSNHPRPAFNSCLHTRTPASASALRIISTACPFPHCPCPARDQGLSSLNRALRCDHSLIFLSPTHLQSHFLFSSSYARCLHVTES